MGKIPDETLRLSIIVNGDPARKEMGELARSTKDLTARNKQLKAELKSLDKESDDYAKRTQQINKEINANNATIDQNYNRYKKLRSELKLTSMTTNELQSRQYALRSLMSKALPGTAQWKKLQTELSAVSLRLAQLRRETNSTESAIGRMATGINKYAGAIMAFMAAAAMYGSGLLKSVQSYSALDEAMSNARKTTGMSREEVEALNAELAKIDTRVPQNELLSIARIAGKLGIAKEDIAGFVKAADVIKIALGKDLGEDVEQTMGSIGKLVDVFKLNKEFGMEAGMMKAAASINELGKSSTANEANIVEFMRRIAGVAPSAKMSFQNMAGLGATVDSLFQSMEVAGTAMSQTIMGMYKRTDAFAAAAKMSVEDFKKLMAEDMNTALLRVLEGMGDMDMSTMTTALNDIKLDGTRCVSVLSVLAQNTETLRTQQLISNTAFEEGTSCLKEYNIMNDTTEAKTEKLKKQILEESAALGKELVPAYHQSLSVKLHIISATRTLFGWFMKSKGVIVPLVATYIAYKIAIFAAAKWEKIHAAALMLKPKAIAYCRLSMRYLTFATANQTLATKTATIATRLFSLAVKASPIGWFIGLISIAAGVVVALAMNTNKATAAQRVYNDVNKRAAEVEDEHGNNIASKAEKMNHLMRVIEDETTAEDRRIRAIKELQGLIPDGIDLINRETIASGEAAKAVAKHTEQLLLQARLKAIIAVKEDKIKEYTKQKLNNETGELSFWQETGVAIRSLGSPMISAVLRGRQSAKNRDAADKDFNKYLEEADKEQSLIETQIVAGGGVVPDPNGSEGGEGGYVPKGDGDEWSLDKDSKYSEAKLKLRQQLLDGEIATEKEYQDKLLQLEIDSLNARLATNIEKGDDKVKLQSELTEKLLDQKNKVQQQEEAAETLRIQNIQDATDKEIAEYERKKSASAGNAAALEQLELQHNRNLASIALKRATDALKIEEDQYKQGRQTMLDRHKLELQTADLTKREKVQKKIEQNNELSAYDEQYLKSALNRLKALSSEGKISFEDIKGVLQSIDLETEFLSEEDKAALLKRIKEIEKALDSATEAVEELGYSFSSKSGDILGFSSDDWDQFFENLKAGKFGLEDLYVIVQTLAEASQMAMGVYSDYDKMVTAKENIQLQKDKKNNDRKKKNLENRLNGGLMTQAQHDAEVERMDAELAIKENEIQVKQAKRQKQMSIAEAIINTAVSVTKALATLGPIAGPIFAAIMGAMGAAQIAMIAATPIAAGYEKGGLVQRSQDGKVFNANHTPKARGHIKDTAFLVSENGPEYVLPSEALKNPTAVPLINMFEAVRQKGQLRDFDFNQVMPAMTIAKGYSTGGYTATPQMPNITQSNSSEMSSAMMMDVLTKLSKQLENPIKADVSMMGRNGILEKQAEHDRKIKRSNFGKL